MKKFLLLSALLIFSGCASYVQPTQPKETMAKLKGVQIGDSVFQGLNTHIKIYSVDDKRTFDLWAPPPKEVC